MLRKTLSLAAVLAGLVGVQFLANAAFDPYVVRVLSVCGVNVMLAVALNLVNGTTGQFSIGHAGFMAVGAYASSLVSVAMERHLGPTMGPVTLVVASLAGIVAAGLTGVAVGVPSLRLRGDYLTIESTPALGGSQGFPLGAESIPAHASLAWIWGAAFLGTLAVWNLTYSSYGRALSAIREDEIAAEAAGVPTTRYKVLAFAISAMLAGLAGTMFAHDATGGQHIDPGAFRLDKSVDMLVMIIFGGLGSITGAVVGGIFVAVSLELLRGVQQYRLIVYAALLIGMMLWRPQGLLGTRELGLSTLRRLIPGRKAGAS